MPQQLHWLGVTCRLDLRILCCLGVVAIADLLLTRRASTHSSFTTRIDGPSSPHAIPAAGNRCSTLWTKTKPSGAWPLIKCEQQSPPKLAFSALHVLSASRLQCGCAQCQSATT